MNWLPLIALKIIGLLEVHPEEPTRDAIPERRSAAFIDDPAQFGQDAIGKTLAVHRDEQVAQSDNHFICHIETIGFIYHR